MKNILLYSAVALLFSFTKLHGQPLLWHQADDNAYIRFNASGKASAPGKCILQQTDLTRLRSLLLTAPIERLALITITTQTGHTHAYWHQAADSLQEVEFVVKPPKAGTLCSMHKFDSNQI